MKYLVKIKYFGEGFSGFQVQPERRTVQGELCEAFEKTFGCKTRVTGCSRTDAGVHANEFYITVEQDGQTIPSDKLRYAVSNFLPWDIAVISAKECHSDFHPRYNAIAKEYVYKIYNSDINDPFLHARVWHYRRRIDDDGLIRMKECANLIVGKKDFKSFMAANSDVTDTVREIKYLDIERRGDMIEIRIAADGFLYNMVRIIVGTLVDCAAGRFSPSDIEKIIASCDRSKAGTTAPASGLYLNRVFY